MTILFLNENPLPKTFTQGTVSGKELRLRACLPFVDHIYVLAAKGKAVVDATKPKQTSFENKIKIIHLPLCPYYLRPIALFFKGFISIRKYQPHLLEAESPLSGMAAVILGKLFNIPTVIEIRSSFSKLAQHRFPWIPKKITSWTVQKVEGWTLRNATAIISNSKYYQKAIRKNYQLKSTVINPGLQYAPQQPTLDRPKTPIKIGYLGRLVSEKGVKFLLEAIKLLTDKPDLPIFTLEIAGLGPQKKELKQYIKDHKLSKYVSFLGFQSNYDILKTWHILVNPITIPTPLEMVNAEAAYMGVPVICFNHNGLPETVRHQETGLKVAPISSKALTNGLVYLLTHPEKRQKLGHNAHYFAKKNYAVSQQVKSLKALYQSLNLP